MSRPRMILPLLMVTVLMSLTGGPTSRANEPPPEAPACISWLPHGYGGNMYVPNSKCAHQKGLHGFRPAPSHIGCWSHPLWGWDVNGYYLGPNVPSPDPATCQLPIGLIYPENGPPPPVEAFPRLSR
jgi:hypothetical protein